MAESETIDGAAETIADAVEEVAADAVEEMAADQVAGIGDQAATVGGMAAVDAAVNAAVTEVLTEQIADDVEGAAAAAMGAAINVEILGEKIDSWFRRISDQLAQIQPQPETTPNPDEIGDAEIPTEPAAITVDQPETPNPIATRRANRRRRIG